MTDITVLNLTPVDMASYLAFRKYEKAVLALLESKALELQGATVQFHIDRQGTITNVKVVEMPLYSTRPLTATPERLVE